ncbi:MAG: pyridoxal 5'-phosphate synthase glutaminase subunit PdxT [bacterium]|nr:pyridoxal 5'-phosphate synthase glutaminase subunit PdxT [bacterium]
MTGLPRTGVLALQGDFDAHAVALRSLGCEPLLVRRVAQLEQVGVLCMPGGESTTMSLLLGTSGLREPLRRRIADGMPVLGTCAGVILLARELGGDTGSLKVEPLGVLDVRVERNAYGRQVDSFEGEVEVEGMEGKPLRAHFIRAPLIRDPGPNVQVLARRGDEIVLVRQGNIIGATFHPEIAGDYRLHEMLLTLRA